MRPRAATLTEHQRDALESPEPWEYVEPTRVDTALAEKDDSVERDISFLKRITGAFTDEDFDVLKESLRRTSGDGGGRMKKVHSTIEYKVPVPPAARSPNPEPFFKPTLDKSPETFKDALVDRTHERSPLCDGKLIQFEKLPTDDRGRRKLADAVEKSAKTNPQPDSLALARKKLEKESALKRAALEQCFGAKHFREYLEKNNCRVPQALSGLSFSTD